MYILFIIIDITLGAWASLGYPFWIICLNAVLVIAASSAFNTSTVQAISKKRFILLGHIVGLVFALIAFRYKLIIFPIWLCIQIAKSIFVSWSDGVLQKNKYIGIKVPTTKRRSRDEILGLFQEWIEDEIVEQECEYKWFRTKRGEICVAFRPGSEWITKQAIEYIRNKGAVFNIPVWIEIMQDIFGQDFSICFVSGKTFETSNFLATAKPGNKKRKKFVPGHPYKRVIDYRPVKTFKDL